MPIEIGGIQLHRVHKITTLEQGTYVYHQVPGVEGEIVQDLGRQSVRLRIEGIFYGPEGATDLEDLRQLYKAREPVDFLADIVGQAYFGQVTLDHLELWQSADEPEQFSFALVVVEYVPPPEAVAPEAFPEVDAAILDQAQSFMDAVTLPDILSLPAFQDPIEPIKGLLSGVQSVMTPLAEVSEALAQLFGTAE